MRLRRHRRDVVVWSSSVGLADRHGSLPFVRTKRRSPIRRLVHTIGILMVISLMGVVRATRPRWRPVLTGLVLPAGAVILRDSLWGLAFLMVFFIFLAAVVSADA